MIRGTPGAPLNYHLFPSTLLFRSTGTTLRAPGRRYIFRREDFVGPAAQLTAFSPTDFFSPQSDFRARFLPPPGGAFRAGPFLVIRKALFDTTSRSEEHTSELQSLMRISFAVFCLKKKKISNY